jgi:acyl-CoA synthetase (AMP-forming)/AMP-acid ligase II
MAVSPTMSTGGPDFPDRVELTPLHFLERSASIFPEKAAISYGSRRYNYREFALEVKLLARAIRSCIKPGDRVAFLAPNLPELLIAHFAVPLAGGVLVALNTRLAPDEIDYILDHSGAVILFADSELLAALGDPKDRVECVRCVVEIVDTNAGSTATHLGTDSYPDFLERSTNDDSPLVWAVDDERKLIAINYTSGTTGRPKGVMYTHRGAHLNSLGFVYHNGYSGDTRYLWTLPMFHCNGWCTTWAVTAAAGLHICLRSVREEAVWNAIDVFDVSHLCGAPTVLSTITEAPQAHVVSHGLKITTGGAPPSPAIIRKLEELGTSVVHAYGLTEVYGPYTTCEYQDSWTTLPADERAARMARQGVGMIQAEIPRVVNEDLVDVAADGKTLGEIIMRGNNVTPGYYRDPEATAAAFRGGWFHSGDLGVMHPDGYIEVKDRAKDVIISGGENISSIEVENALLAQIEVLDAAVVAERSEKWGERPVAYLVIREGFELVAVDLKLRLRSSLAAYKVPDRFIVVESLPRTSTGKVLKRSLRETTTPLT